ncbi:hypothetical protein [Nonomuraea basaltis]|uniref:hypothetical protein n=1 Tax=Nonomuraea basaltis TaxID=2495887 RepID=UPI0014866DDA|nr:hypothetical protein [Nonomuraea basaltis]
MRWPNGDYRAALRAICGADEDKDLGFARPRRRKPPTTVADVDRKQFIRTAVG